MDTKSESTRCSRTPERAIALGITCLAMLIGCFPIEQDPSSDSISDPRDTTKVGRPDTGKTSDTSVTIKTGWEGFPEKYLSDLKELSAKTTHLPTPYGFIYFPLDNDPLLKAASGDCPDGPREIFGLSNEDRGMYVTDTIRYFEEDGKADCRWNSPTIARVTHNRYILDLRSGQAWEEVVDSVSNQLILPRHSFTGKGRIRLKSGLEFAMESIEVEILTPFRQPGVNIMSARLRMAWKNGYTFDLKMVKDAPLKAVDFLPIRETPAAGDRMMSGPIRHDTTTVGYMDLYSDHAVVIRDWAGKPLPQ